MQTNKFAEDYSSEELMTVVAAKNIKNREIVFVGIGIPMIAAFFAIQNHAPDAVLIFEGGYIGGRPQIACTDVGDSTLGFKAPYITSVWRTFSDLQKGYCHLAIIGAAQVDRYGNVNSTVISGGLTHSNQIIRLPGSGGANDMMSSAKRTLIMARLEKRRFVSQVDYVTSPGYMYGPGAREKAGLKGGGPIAVITDKGVFRFDPDSKEMYLDSVYPNTSIRKVKQEVSWPLKVSKRIKKVTPPTIKDVEFIRKYDPIDIILRRRSQFNNMEFSSWIKLMRNTLSALHS